MCFDLFVALYFNLIMKVFVSFRREILNFLKKHFWII